MFAQAGKAVNNSSSQSNTVDSAPVRSDRADAMIALAKARTCATHGGQHCWVPCSEDLKWVEDYALQNVGHIRLTDAEMAMWVDELVHLATTPAVSYSLLY